MKSSSHDNPRGLYVHHECDGLLSLRREFDDEHGPVWSWRQYILYEFTSDPDHGSLDEDALDGAKAYFWDWTGINLDDPDDDYGQCATREEAEGAFARWLDEPHPKNDDPDGPAWDWWDRTHSATAMAVQFVETLHLTLKEEDGFYVDDDPRPTVRVDEDGLGLLKIVVGLHYPEMEIIETRPKPVSRKPPSD